MAKSKRQYYAVRIGSKLGIYESWEECKEQVLGFPGADYKGFETREEAEQYLAESPSSPEATHSSRSKKSQGEFWVVLSDFAPEQMDAVIQHVTEEFKDAEIRKDEPQDGKRLVVIRANRNEKVTLTRYDTGRFVMQGRPRGLFAAVLTYLGEEEDLPDAPTILRTSREVHVEDSEIDQLEELHLPHSHQHIRGKLKSSLRQALVNLKLDGNLPDPTFLAYPALRALEGHLKMVLLETGIVDSTDNQKYLEFNMFERHGQNFRLQQAYQGKAAQDIENYVCRCYKFHQNNRHALFHWETPVQMNSVDGTQTLDIRRARDVIERTLRIVDEYYQLTAPEETT